MIDSSLMITTTRLYMLPFERKHITVDYIAWLNDEELMKFSEQRHYKHTKKTCEDYMSCFEDSENMFLAIENLDRNLIGTITIYRDLRNEIVDIGIMIGAKAERKKGLGSEAWTATVKWIEQELKPRKITAGCMATNVDMIKIMHSVGMQADGIRKMHFLQNGQAVDIIYMAKLNK